MRQKGFEDVAEGRSRASACAGVVDGRNIQDNAMSAAETLMTANPDLDRDLRHRRAGAAGRDRGAVESQGRQDKVKIVGWDLTAGRDQGHR